MKRFLIFTCFAVLASGIFAQSTNNKPAPCSSTQAPYCTSAPCSRYEVISFPTVNNYFIKIKIDKYTGDTWIANTNFKGVTKWEHISREKSTEDDVIQNTINYQICANGIPNEYGFAIMININTGTSWELSRKFLSNCYWSKIIENNDK